MNKFFGFFGRNYLPIQAIILAFAAVISLDKPNLFWGLMVSSIVVFSLDEIIKELRNLNSK